MSPLPRYWHQKIVLNIASAIREHLRNHRVGEVIISPSDVELTFEDVYQPVVYFIAQERLAILTEQGPSGAPDLVVEVLSPGTAKLDLGPKREVYGAAGVKEMWVMDARQRKIDIYMLQEVGLRLVHTVLADDTIEPPLIPGLTFDVSEIFES